MARRPSGGKGFGPLVGLAILVIVGWVAYERLVPVPPPVAFDAGAAPEAPVAPEEVAGEGALEDGGEPEAQVPDNVDAGFEVSLEPAEGVVVDDEEGLVLELAPVDDAGVGAVQTERTDGDGVAHFGRLPAGRYRLALHDPRFAEIAEETDVAAGGNETLVLVLDDSADVSGEVRDPEGHAVAGAGLTFGPDSTLRVVSGADGRFACGHCPASATELDVDPPAGFVESEPQVIKLQRGANPPLHVVLRRLRPLEVVVDFGGAPPSAGEARVELEGPGGYQEVREIGSDDRVRFDGVPPEPVQAEVLDETGALATGTSQPGNATLQLLVPSNSLEVEVSGAARGRGSPVVVQCQGSEPRNQVPDRGGRARFRWLPAKPCEVQYESQARTTVTPPGHVKLEVGE